MAGDKTAALYALAMSLPAILLGAVEAKQPLVTAHARDHGVDVDGLVAADTAATREEPAVEAAVAEYVVERKG
jgi:hypothetical protein